MVNQFNYEMYATKLLDANLGITIKTKHAVELRDSREFYQNDNGTYLSRLIPVLLSILNDEAPSFSPKAFEQKLRSTILEIFNRLPFNEPLKPYVVNIAKALLKCFVVDNEDNAITSLKILVELHRVYGVELQDQLMGLFEAIRDLLLNMEQNVAKFFNGNLAITPAGATPNPNNDTPKPFSPASDTADNKKVLSKGQHSFKVLIECPAILKPLNLAYRDIIVPYVELIYPAAIAFLKAQAPSQQEAHDQAREKGEVFIGISSEIKNRQLYSDFTVAQIKIISFLCVLHKGNIYNIIPYFGEVIDIIARLLCDCPPDHCSLKRDLFFDITYVLCLEAKPYFLKNLEVFLSEKAMGWDGLTTKETIKYFSYSVVAEIVHYFRRDITHVQIKKITHIFIRGLFETHQSNNMQMVCAKLLINIIDSISQNNNKSEARLLVMHILNAFASKIDSINTAFPQLKEAYLEYKSKDNPPNYPTILNLNAENIEYFDFEKIRPLGALVKPAQNFAESLRETRTIFRNIFQGLETIMRGLISTNPESGNNSGFIKEYSIGFTLEDTRVFCKLFRDTVKCIYIYSFDTIKEDKNRHGFNRNVHSIIYNSDSADIKEILRTMVFFYHHLDLAITHEVFNSNIEYFFESFLENPALVQLPKVILMSDRLSHNFGGILINFLMERLDQLGTAGPNLTNCMITLFTMIFQSLSHYPVANEALLLNCVTKVIRKCFEYSTQLDSCANYYVLLDSFFNYTATLHLDKVLNTIMGLLPQIVSDLSLSLSITSDPELRALLIRLLLTIFVTVAPYMTSLSQFMKPLCLALTLNYDLITKALKTLHLVIDNITPEALESAIAPAADEVCYCLWRHIRPPPYDQEISMSAIRILGKLAGFNRLFMQYSPTILYDQSIENYLKFSIEFDGKTPTLGLPFKNMVKMAYLCLFDASSDHLFKSHSIKLVKCFLSALVKIDDIKAEDIAILKIKANSFFEENNNNNEDSKLGIMDIIPSEQELIKIDQIDFTKSTNLKVITYENGNNINNEEIQKEVLILIFKSIFLACTYTELYEETWSILEGIVSYYTSIKVLQLIDPTINQCTYDSDKVINQNGLDIFFDTLLDMSTCDNPKLRKLAYDIIFLIEQRFIQLLDNEKYLHKLPFFQELCNGLCNFCYSEELYRKDAACSGIMLIVNKMKLDIQFLIKNEPIITMALIFALKSASSSLSTPYSSSISNSLQQIILKVYSTKGNLNDTLDYSKTLEIVIKELFSSNGALREVAKSIITLFATITKKEISTILTPFSEIILDLMFSRVLRSLPFSIMIGAFDAIAFLLNAKCSFVNGEEHLPSFIAEALALLDSDDNLYKSSEVKDDTTMIKFRKKSIQVILSALSFVETTSQPAVLRARAQKVFFKFLHNNHNEIAEAAKSGLKELTLYQSKLPKDLLQEVLKPYLSSISDYSALTVPHLRGLAKLLDILQHYFKIEIGVKLFESMKKWADNNVLKEIATTQLNDRNEVKIIQAILNIFHLLPPNANSFIKDLVPFAVEFEALVRRDVSSPIRIPLIKYLNKYPTDTNEFIFKSLEDDKYAHFFISLLSMESATELRKDVINNTDKLIRNTIEIKDESKLEYYKYYFIDIVSAICNYHPNFLIDKPIIMENLMKLWKSPSRLEKIDKEIDLKVIIMKETLYIAQLFVKYLKHNIEDVNIMFELSVALNYNSELDLSFIKSFIRHQVLTMDLNLRRNILLKFLQSIDSNNFTTNGLTSILHYLINPMMLVAFIKAQDVTKLLDEPILTLIKQKIWNKMEVEKNNDTDYEDYLKLELIQFTTLLLQFSSNLINNFRKEIIQFGFAYSKLEDNILKQSANLLLARFIAAYITPDNIIINVYGTLLKAVSMETKVLNRMALDTLIQSIHTRSLQKIQDNFPIWVRFTKQILSEENYNIIYLLNIYSTLCRHAEVFYDFRVQFITPILYLLPKLNINHSSADSKSLSIQLTDLIFKWECILIEKNPNIIEDEDNSKRINKEKENDNNPIKKLKNEINITNIKVQSTNNNLSKEFILTDQMKSLVLETLIKLYCSCDDPASRKANSGLVLNIFNNLINLITWKQVPITFKPIESILKYEFNEENFTQMMIVLEMVMIIIKSKSKNWIDNNITMIKNVLSPCIVKNNYYLSCCLHPILKYLFHLLPGPDKIDHNPMSLTLQTLIESTISKGLSDNATLTSSLILLDSISLTRLEIIDNFVPILVKLLQRLSKELITNSNNTKPNNNNPSKIQQLKFMYPFLNNNSSEVIVLQESLINSILLIINILKLRIGYLADHRKSLLNSMCAILDKGIDHSLLNNLFNIIKEWILNPIESFPTLKEKANLLASMTDIENRGDNQLKKQFYELVYDIYTKKYFTNTELTVKLEAAFLLGTKHHDINIRNNFLKLFSHSLPSKLIHRLKYILNLQNWERLADSYWLVQATYILLGSVLPDLKVRLFNSNSIIDKAFEKYSNNNEMVNFNEENIDEHSTIISNNIKILKDQLDALNNKDIIESLQILCLNNNKFVHELWINLFPIIWTILNEKEKGETIKYSISLFCKPYHIKQFHLRPNIIQSLLEGFEKCNPAILLPPHLIKYLAIKFNVWHTSIRLLDISINDIASKHDKDGALIRMNSEDALSEILYLLNEHDMYYSLWSMRCRFSTTGLAVSYSALSLYPQALQTYELAQSLAGKLQVPTCESEFNMWEQEWVKSNQYLQKWDLIDELGEQSNNLELQLLAKWHTKNLAEENNGYVELLNRFDFNDLNITLNYQMRLYKSFLFLVNNREIRADFLEEFNKLNKEVNHSICLQWFMLPQFISNSHLNLLSVCQQLYELEMSISLFNQLSEAHLSNIDIVSVNIDKILAPWRNKLPNNYDNLNMWSDIISFRMQVFNKFNKLIKSFSNKMDKNQLNNLASKGHYEQAWLLNKFSITARKQSDFKTSLEISDRIYELPNIHISEAFVKLISQAKCYLFNNEHLHKGLEILNKASINFFSPIQKVSYFTLKAQFLFQLNQIDEANQAFSSATQMDLSIPKSWAHWGQFNESLFYQKNNIEQAIYAVNCFNQASILYKNNKSRKYISSIINLLNMDDENASIANSFDQFIDELPIWYYIFFIPQLISSLYQPNANQIQKILLAIAKKYPQAIYYHLLTAKDEFLVFRNLSNDKAKKDNKQNVFKYGLELIQEVIDTIKLQSPLYSITANNLITKFKNLYQINHEDHILNLLSQLLSDNINRLNQFNIDRLEDGQANNNNNSNQQQHDENNKKKLLEIRDLLPNDIIKQVFGNTFLKQSIDNINLIYKIKVWKSHYQNIINKKHPNNSIELIDKAILNLEGANLNDILIPGQYNTINEKSYDLIKMMRILPKLKIIRKNNNQTNYVIGMRGNNGKMYKYLIDCNSSYNSRREERFTQLNSLINTIFSKNNETIKRHLLFHLPKLIPMGHNIRLVEFNHVYLNQKDILNHYLKNHNVKGFNDNQDIEMYYLNKMYNNNIEKKDNNLILNYKVQLIKEIQQNIVDPNYMINYFKSTIKNHSELFAFQKNFSYQLSLISFFCYTFSIGLVDGTKLNILSKTGDIWLHDVYPTLNTNGPLLISNEHVPFRLTPSLQNLINRLNLNGNFANGIIAAAKAIILPKDQLNYFLKLFLREEILYFKLFYRYLDEDNDFDSSMFPLKDTKEMLFEMDNQVMNRIKYLACMDEIHNGPNIKHPITKPVLDLISQATNPVNIASMDYQWMPWL